MVIWSVPGAEDVVVPMGVYADGVEGEALQLIRPGEAGHKWATTRAVEAPAELFARIAQLYLGRNLAPPAEILGDDVDA